MPYKFDYVSWVRWQRRPPPKLPEITPEFLEIFHAYRYLKAKHGAEKAQEIMEAWRKSGEKKSRA